MTIDHYEALLDSPFLRWFDLQGQPALVEIKEITQEELTLAGGAKKRCPVMAYRQLQGKIEHQKRLVLKKPPKKPQPPASDESASQIREVVKAFSKLENRMSALKKMLKSLEHHELCILKDWIDDHQEHQGKAKQ